MTNVNTKKMESGLTKQRKVVWQVIQDAKEHLTANEIFDEAKSILPGISFATVYNSLRYLKDAELIAEKNFGGGASRFDRMTGRHDHAVCNKCGKLVDMQIEMPQELIESATQFSNFKLESIELTLRGLCPDCTK